MGEALWTGLSAEARPLDADRLRASSPLLIIAPHADDETLGCGGLIAEATDRGLSVRVVYLTDGAASHLGSPTWPPHRLATLRRAEALAALHTLGVAHWDVLFLDWPDACPHPVSSTPFRRSVEAVRRWLEPVPPRSLWAPWRGEQHCDHRAARDLALALQRCWPHVARYDYLVWGWRDAALCEAHHAGAVWRLDCAHHVDRRRRALGCHASQLGGVIVDARQAFQIAPELAALTDRPSEIFLEDAA